MPHSNLIARLSQLHPKRIDLGLERMQRLLQRLDHPERRLPPVIHVAGTNGKGSTVAFMRAMLEAAGKSVHVYTSPNLVRINERFRLGRPGGGVLVEDGELADANRIVRNPPRRSATQPHNCCATKPAAPVATPATIPPASEMVPAAPVA